MKSEKFKVPKVFKDLKDLKFYGINSLFNCYFDSFCAGCNDIQSGGNTAEHSSTACHSGSSGQTSGCVVQSYVGGRRRCYYDITVLDTDSKFT